MDKKERILNEKVDRISKEEQVIMPEQEVLKGKELFKSIKMNEKKEKLAFKKRKKDKKEQDRVERRNLRIAKKNKKNAKIAKHRKAKNFGWWFFGYISFVLILVAIIAVSALLIPVKMLTGDDSSDYVSDDIASMSLFEALLGIADYTVKDVPAVKVLLNTIQTDLELDKYISIDTDSLDDTTIISEDFLTDLLDSIKVIATLSSTGVSDMLGDFGTMDAFTSYELVPLEELPDESGTDFNYLLYYYRLEEGVYLPAFTEDYERVEEAVDKDLYYPALNEVPVLDLGDVFSDRLDRERMTSLLGAVGMETGGAIYDIVGDKTVSEMKSFNMDDVKLTAVIKIPEDKGSEDYRKVSDLYKMLMDANSVSYTDSDFEEKANELTVAQLSGMDINDVKLTTVLSNKLIEGGEGKRENEDLYKILRDISYDKCVVNYFNKYNEAHVGEEIDMLQAKTAYDGLTDSEKNDYITISCLSGADIKSIKLTSVLEDSDANTQLYAILRDMTGKENNSDIVVGDLNGVDVTHIKLLNVLPMGENNKNEKLYNILRDLSYKNVIAQYMLDHSCDEETAKSEYALLSVDEQNALITVASLDNSDISRIKLSNVIDKESSEVQNNKILKVLVADDSVTVGNMADKINALKVSEIFAVDVFTTEVANACTYGDSKNVKYAKSQDAANNDVYTLDEGGDYYISNSASIWLLMLYTSGDCDADGFGLSYTSNGTTFADMDTFISNSLGSAISNASIRQLVSAGIFSNTIDYTGSYNKKLSNLLAPV